MREDVEADMILAKNAANQMSVHNLPSWGFPHHKTTRPERANKSPLILNSLEDSGGSFSVFEY